MIAGTVDLNVSLAEVQYARVEEVATHDLFHFEVDTAIPTNDIALLKVCQSRLKYM